MTPWSRAEVLSDQSIRDAAMPSEIGCDCESQSLPIVAVDGSVISPVMISRVDPCIPESDGRVYGLVVRLRNEYLNRREVLVELLERTSRSELQS